MHGKFLIHGISVHTLFLQPCSLNVWQQYTNSHRVPVADRSANSSTATNVRSEAPKFTMTDRLGRYRRWTNVPSSTASNDSRSLRASKNNRTLLKLSNFLNKSYSIRSTAESRGCRWRQTDMTSRIKVTSATARFRTLMCKPPATTRTVTTLIRSPQRPDNNDATDTAALTHRLISVGLYMTRWLRWCFHAPQRCNERMRLNYTAVRSRCVFNAALLLPTARALTALPGTWIQRARKKLPPPGWTKRLITCPILGTI